MKTLYIVRHAKSSWKQEYLTDFERPLNKRGHGDAPMIGRALVERGVRIGRIRCSPANRALTTARMLAVELGCSTECIETDDHMYGAGDMQLLGIVQSLPDSEEAVMMVGHNPGMHMLAERLAGFDEDNLPTCGVVCVDIAVSSWQDVTPGSGSVRFYDYPKKYY